MEVECVAWRWSVLCGSRGGVCHVEVKVGPAAVALIPCLLLDACLHYEQIPLFNLLQSYENPTRLRKGEILGDGPLARTPAQRPPRYRHAHSQKYLTELARRIDDRVSTPLNFKKKRLNRP